MQPGVELVLVVKLVSNVLTSKLQVKKITTGRPTKQDSFYIVKNVFFHNLLGCLIPDNNKNIIKESYYSKINFNVKHI